MESHKKILGVLYIVSGVLQIIILMFVAILVNTIFPFAQKQAEPDEALILEMVAKLVQIIPAVIIIIISIPSLIAGIGLLNAQKWALLLALILGCFKLFSFPIGTALGVYTIWVYAQDQKQSKA